MILPMSRVRLIGPRDRLDETLHVLQDLGAVQLDETAPAEGLQKLPRDPAAVREERYLERLLGDAESAIALLGVSEQETSAPEPSREQLATWAREARRTRQRADRLRERRTQLEEERALLQRYRDFLEAFEGLLAGIGDGDGRSIFGITLPAAERPRLDRLATELRRELGADVRVASRGLPAGDIAVLFAVPAAARPRMERALGAAHIPEVPIPSRYGGGSVAAGAPAMLSRLRELPDEMQEIDRQRAALAEEVGAELRRRRAAAHDRLATLRARRLTAATPHAFSLEGWLPSELVPRLRSIVAERLDDRVLIEELSRESWRRSTAPVELSNPRLFRPFERLTRLMPLPRYGSIDPTPFLAVGFPMLFGMILGDVGYALMLAGLAVLLRHRAVAGSMRRAVADIAFACAAFSAIFGVLFGEFFGTTGTQLFGMRPLLLDREHAVVAAIVAAVGVGLVHTVLGLVLGMLSAGRREPRVAISRGVQLAMLALVVLALLAAVHVLPAPLFTPLAVAALVGFPVLLALEGIVAPIEFFSTLGSVLSYVRIMALGTASVMLATLANQLSGTFGSALVGVLFALLFHLVNFALGLVSPTLHALRLHYVEFFRNFYSPGGRQYEPYAHWRPEHGRAS